MKIIGITGGVGAGKTTVITLMQQHFPVIFLCCDTIAHDLMRQGKEAYEQIVAHYGARILAPDKEIDRKKLSQVAFLEEGNTDFLNHVIHPLVQKQVETEIAMYREKQSDIILVIEAALLLEAGYQDICDEIWYVYASEETRRKRLEKNRQYTNEKIDALFQKQYKEEQFQAGCDFMIENEDTEKQTKGSVLEQIKKRLKV